MERDTRSLITDDGYRLHYQVQGQGMPLVILHGWTSSHREWLPYLERLAQQYRVYAWDARGHALHPFPARHSIGLTRMAEDLEQLMERENLQNVALLGHSMGALTTWEYCRRFGTERLAAICLLDQSPRLITGPSWPHGIYGHFSPEQNDRFIRRLRDNFAEAVLELAAFGLNPDTLKNYRQDTPGFQRLRKLLGRLHSGPLAECWESLTQADLRPVLPSINTPTLLIYGQQSQFYTHETARYVHQHMPNSKLLTYAQADHSPHLWQPERFIRDLERFLAAHLADSPRPGA